MRFSLEKKARGGLENERIFFLMSDILEVTTARMQRSAADRPKSWDLLYEDLCLYEIHFKNIEITEQLLVYFSVIWISILNLRTVYEAWCTILQ